MAVRYEGGAEPDLELDDFTNGTTNNTTSIKTFGKSSTLLAWHLADPVDDFERRRNARIFFHQGNRNPFIDNPEFARAVFDPNYQAIRFVIMPAVADPVSGPAGGPFAPESQSFTVTNTSTAPISLTIDTDVPWLSANAGSFAVAASGSASVAVLINSALAPSDPGIYAGRVRVTDEAAGYFAEYEVSLTVTSNVEEHYWEYEWDGFDGAIITAYYGQGGEVQIPSEIDGLPVVQLGNGYNELFFYNGTLSGNAVTSVTIPSGVTTIADFAFYYSDGLTTVHIGESVVDIGGDAFRDCWDLLNIHVDANNQQFASRDGVLLDKTEVALLRYPTGRLGSYVIPEGIFYVWDEAFAGCYGLSDVTIPYGVGYIGVFAFADCYNLASVFIPQSVEIIQPFAFYNCGQMSSITVDPASPYYASEDGVLFNKSKSTLVAYPAGRIGPYAIPAGVTTIEIGAFTSCYGLTSVILPETLASIGQYAFSDCVGLASVTIPDSLANVHPEAFTGCEQLADVLLRGDPPANGAWIGALPSNTKLHHLPGTGGWQPIYGDRATQVFRPMAAPSAFVANAFQFNWSNTGSIPMNVWRATSLNGPWTLVSSNNPSSSFTDYSTPAGNAFYRAALP
jgi:hypothetical protein